MENTWTSFFPPHIIISLAMCFFFLSLFPLSIFVFPAFSFAYWQQNYFKKKNKNFLND